MAEHRIDKDKFIYMLCHCLYRHCKLLPELDRQIILYNLSDKVTRLDQGLAPLDQLASEGKYVLAAGDLNIDHLISNDPTSRYDLAKLHECLDISKNTSSLD